VATSDPIAEIIRDYRAFAAMQRDRLAARGIDIAPYALSHLAVRVDDWDLYVHQRTLLERHASANRESVWNGRPIFEDFTHVKFYRRSFFDVVEDEEGRFEGFNHVDDWVPRLVTATGPNPLPR
jgi:predicted metalloenzyme YecM